MGNYDANNDILYDEAVVARDVIELVDLMRHSARVISQRERSPFVIRGRKIQLRSPKSHYSFFNDLWEDKEVVPSLTVPGEEGLRISDLHVIAMIYALRQDFFVRVDPQINGSRVGWYLDPKTVFIEVLPDFFEDFQSVYESKGALGLQGRESDILGTLSNDVAQYVQRNFRPNSDPPFKSIEVKDEVDDGD
jgi:hypothetical protein